MLDQPEHQGLHGQRDEDGDHHVQHQEFDLPPGRVGEPGQEDGYDHVEEGAAEPFRRSARIPLGREDRREIEALLLLVGHMFHYPKMADMAGYWAQVEPTVYPGTRILRGMLTVSIVIPAWNEEERIEDCLLNATRQSQAPKEVLVVDNHSTDATASIVQQFIDQHPDQHVKLLHQDSEQGLIPTRNYGLDRATGDVLGRIDADCMLRPNWVEVVSGIFTRDPKAMGATGPVAYYDMPGKKIGLKGDNTIRRAIYRADDGQYLLYGSNMALRATAWRAIRNQVCRDKEDIMHEDVDISLHLIDQGFKTVYCKDMNVGISARRMDTSFTSFRHYMQRFKNTFDAHPQHTREQKPEHTLYAIYPILRAFYPVYQKYLESADINPAERVWIREQMELFHRRDQELDQEDH